MKKFRFLSVVLSVLLLVGILSGCASMKKYDGPVITGTIERVDEYGDLIPSFKVPEFNAKGFEYGDMLLVKIGDLKPMKMAYVTAYTDVGTMGICFCDYSKRGDEITIAITNASFFDWIGGNEGDAIEVKLAEKAGFLDEYNNVQVILSNNRSDYASDEIFANFRMVETTGIKKGVLYRASNPLNAKKNKVRYTYVDKLAQKAGIKTEIDLADTTKVLEPVMAASDYNAPYCSALLKKGNVSLLGMKADFFLEESFQKIAEGLRFMLTHDAPYLIHCNEGKDRAGAFIMVLEALAGASIDEIKYDYMTTYVNYYTLDRNSNKYRDLEEITIDHLIYLFANPEKVKKLQTINWDKVSTKGIDIQKASENFLLNNVKLTPAEVAALKAKLTK